MLRNMICTYIFLSLMAGNAQAQYQSVNDFNFKTYSSTQGLADNIVVKTVRDQHGFLWIATHNGISRFDGLTFKQYSHNPADSTSLRSIWISDLLVDDTKTLWASTEYGLCYYDENADRFVYVNKPTEVQLVFKMPMCKDDDHTIWIAAEDGLKKVNTKTKTYKNTSFHRIADPQFVLVISPAELLIGTRGKGLYRYNKIEDRYKKISIQELPEDVHFMDAIQDAGTTWIATSEGLLQWNGEERCKLFSSGAGPLAGHSIKQLMCVQKFEAAFGQNKMICGTYDKKLLLFDKEKLAFTHEWKASDIDKESFNASIVYSLQADAKMFWIGTSRGLLQVNLENKEAEKYFILELIKGRSNALITKVMAGDEAGSHKRWMIAGRPYNGILLYDIAQRKVLKEWHTVNTQEQRTYNDLIFSPQQHCIIAARDSAIDFYDEARGCIKTIPIKGKVLCLAEDEQGNLWIGHSEGLTYLNTRQQTQESFVSGFTGTEVERNSYGGSFPVNSLKIKNHELWLASIKYGLFSFNLGTQKFIAHRQPSAADFSTRNRASSILITAADSIWVGTMAGLSCYIPSQKKYLIYTAANGFKSTYIYSIVQDDAHRIWARGNADLSCFNIASQKVIGSRPNQWVDIDCHLQKLFIQSNKVYLGQEGGFSVLDSSAFAHPAATLPVAFVALVKVNDSTIYFDRSRNRIPLKLRYFQNQLNVELGAIEFNDPEAIQYHYRLSGIDKGWTNAGTKRAVSYRNLPPGRYNFEFFVLNTQSRNRSRIDHFAFAISPALWQHWWFWPLLALLFAIGVVGIARKRIRAIKEKEKQRTAINKAMAELETKMLRSQMNPHFIFNSLNSIQKYIWENKEEDAAEYLARFAKLMRAILENSREETISLAAEMEVMKLYVDLEHRRSNGGFDYTIKAAPHLIESKLCIPPLIMQPFIENAIWHGLNKKATKGNLSVEVSEKEGHLVCVIDDDGVGRQQQTKQMTAEKKSLGIDITQQRIKRLAETTGQLANIQIEDKSQNGLAMGTTVTITLPLQTG